jgi:hypothetical protein
MLMRRLALAQVAFLFGVSTSVSAFAATVIALQGQVLINRGQGYRVIEGTTEAGPGDTIVANPGGAAQIVYANGCTEKVVPQSVVTISRHSPCRAEKPPRPRATAEVPVDGTTIVLGGAVVAGAITAAVLLIPKKSRPASP